MKALTLIAFLSPFSTMHSMDQDTCTKLINKCDVQLNQDKKYINALTQVSTKQLTAFRELFANNLVTQIDYKDGLYYLTISGSIDIYGLDPETYEIVKAGTYPINQIETHKFSSKIQPRPFSVLPNIFKLGGGIFYNQDTKKAYPDIVLMYELLSFDRLLSLYGFSINLSLGIKHVGGNLGYQFHRSSYFSNTSFFMGYSYNFIEFFPSAYGGISLNF